MNPHDPHGQVVGAVICGLICLGGLCAIIDEIRCYVERKRQMKKACARILWLRTPEQFRGPEPK